MGADAVVLDHPLAATWVTALRDEATPPVAFRAAVRQLSWALAWEAMRDTPVEPVPVRTPLTDAVGARRRGAPPLLVPVLRAGLWMLDAVLELVADAVVGVVGMARDEDTLQPATYVDRLPSPIGDRPVFVLDPMLATGGSLCAVGALLGARGVARATVLSVIAAPEGLARVATELPGWSVVTAAVDDHLDGRGFIVPGLGDAGDRLCG